MQCVYVHVCLKAGWSCSPVRRSLKELQALAVAGAQAGGEPLPASQAGAKGAAAQKPPPAGKAAAKVGHVRHSQLA